MKHASKMSLILSKYDRNDRYTAMSILDFHWYRNLNKTTTTVDFFKFYWAAGMEMFACAEVYPLCPRSADLSTDPGLKSHCFTSPCSK
jgi:hypothetical protein